MNIFVKFFLIIISIPARIKGIKFGRNSYINYGYDFVIPCLKNIFLGDNCQIGKRASMQTDGGGMIEIGNGCVINRNFTISSRKNIKIGNNCLLSYNVSLIDSGHIFQRGLSPAYSGFVEGKSIELGERCFIGAHSFVMPGVKLGNNCVVGANSVVVDSFPDNSVIAGSPAKLIRML